MKILTFVVIVIIKHIRGGGIISRIVEIENGRKFNGKLKCNKSSTFTKFIRKLYVRK